MNIELISKGSAGDKKFESVPEFLPNSHFFMSIVGMRGSGKSLLTNNLLKQFYLKEFDNILVFCPTQKLNGDYKWLEEYNQGRKDPKIFFYTNPREFKGKIEKVKEIQTGYILDENVGRENTPNILLILDDCAQIKSIFGQFGFMQEFSLIGRHLKISVIVISQALKLIGTKIRLNSNMLILFRCVNNKETESFIEEYVLKSQKNDVKKVIDKVFRERYNFIAINNDVKDIDKTLTYSKDFIPIFSEIKKE